MKIYYAATGLPFRSTFGPSIHILNLSKALSKKADISVIFGCIRSEIPTELGFDVKSLNFDFQYTKSYMIPTRLYEYQKRIQNLSKDIDCDILIERMWPYGGFLSKELKKRGIPYILDIEEGLGPRPTKKLSTYNLKKTLRYKLIENKVKDADFIITRSTHLKESIIKTFNINKDKIKEISNGVDLDLFHPTDNPLRKDNKLRLIYVGSLDKVHDMTPILLALADLKRDYLELHIVGAGQNKKQYQDLTSELNIKNSCFFYGGKKIEWIAEKMRDMDIGIAPYEISDFKGRFTFFPLKILEYMASGIPTVSYPYGAIKTLISKDNGFLIEDSVEGWKSCLQNLPSKSELHEMGLKARKKSEKYSWDNIADQYLEICNKILDSRR